MHVRHQSFPFGSVEHTYMSLFGYCMHAFLTSLQYWGFQIIIIGDMWKNVYVHSTTLHATMVNVANTCTTKQWFLSDNYGKPTTTFTLLLNIRSEYRHCSHWLMIHQSNAPHLLVYHHHHCCRCRHHRCRCHSAISACSMCASATRKKTTSVSCRG